jgi:hypothetical protein
MVMMMMMMMMMMTTTTKAPVSIAYQGWKRRQRDLWK